MMREEVNQLLVQLPQAKNATETFSIFADKVQRIFAGLQHTSILLLPQDTSAPSSKATPASFAASSGVLAAPAGRGGAASKAAAATSGNSSSGGRGAAAPSSSSGSHRAPGLQVLSSAGVSPLPGAPPGQALRTGGGLDWSNCCVFHLLPGRGAVVQPPPPWPATCTATCYAALTSSGTSGVGGGALVTGDYRRLGPHFLDWKSLAERGCVSMAAVPLFSRNRPVAVLCLASDQPDAFADGDTLQLLGGLLSPYCSQLEFTTRRSEMQRLVNEVITPIAAQLAQQKHSQLARLGCTVEEAPPGSVATDGKGVSVAVGSHSSRSGATASSSLAAAGEPGQQLAAGPVAASGAGSRRGGRGCGGAGGARGGAAAAAAVGGGPLRGGKAAASAVAAAAAAAVEGSVADGLSLQSAGHQAGRSSGRGPDDGGQGISHKRFESVIVKSQPSPDGFSGSPDLDLDWSDFFFNLVSMAIVYVYFSKAAVAGESLVAILLCMGVAAFDIVLLVMRWLWFEQYINYGSIVLSVFQVYRVVVLPVANTWMSWSLLNKMSVTPSWPMIALLGVILMACIIMGLQVRFFLHAPLQLASVLFAATSTPDICGAFFDSTSSLHCIGIISAVQLSLGLVLPSLMVYFLEGRSGRHFLPHMQAKRFPS